MNALVKRNTIIFSLIAAVTVWLLWGAVAEVGAFISAAWGWRPHIVIGAGMILGSIALAFPAEYFLNIRRRGADGAIRVSGFADYIGHGTFTVFVKWTLVALFFVGLFIMLFGFDIR